MTEPKKKARKQQEATPITVDATGGEEHFDEARIRALALKEQKPPKEKRIVLKQGERPEPKARGRAKAKAKAASIVIIDSEEVDAPAPAPTPEEVPEPQDDAPQQEAMQVDEAPETEAPPAAPAAVEETEMMMDTEAAPAAAQSSENKKKKGHRPKKEDKEDLKEKTSCPDCGKTMSLHNLKYLHKSKCKPQAASANEAANIPTTEIPSSSSQQPTYAPINQIATPLQMLTQTQNALEEWRKMRATHKVERYRNLTKSFLK